jgi:hypothetical protein
VETSSRATGSSSVNPLSFRKSQRALWSEQRRLGNEWRITDFVTLGSPLTYASFLLADGTEDFQDRLVQRVLPTCPPQLEDGRDIGFTSKEYTVGAERRTLRLLHHAAPFACTRWTNLYFPGDIIGGPVSSSLGWAVYDQPISSEQWWGFGGRLPTSHTRYWNTSERSALAALRQALDLPDEDAPSTLNSMDPVS